MSVYAVVLNVPSENTMTKLKEHLGNRMYVVTNHLAFVSPQDTTLTSEVADLFQLDDGSTGVVIEVENYSGFNHKALWEWLEKFS